MTGRASTVRSVEWKKRLLQSYSLLSLLQWTLVNWTSKLHGSLPPIRLTTTPPRTTLAAHSGLFCLCGARVSQAFLHQSLAPGTLWDTRLRAWPPSHHRDIFRCPLSSHLCKKNIYILLQHFLMSLILPGTAVTGISNDIYSAFILPPRVEMKE